MFLPKSIHDKHTPKAALHNLNDLSAIRDRSAGGQRLRARCNPHGVPADVRVEVESGGPAVAHPIKKSKPHL